MAPPRRRPLPGAPVTLTEVSPLVHFTPRSKVRFQEGSARDGDGELAATSSLGRSGPSSGAGAYSATGASPLGAAAGSAGSSLGASAEAEADGAGAGAKADGAAGAGVGAGAGAGAGAGRSGLSEAPASGASGRVVTGDGLVLADHV